MVCIQCHFIGNASLNMLYSLKLGLLCKGTEALLASLHPGQWGEQQHLWGSNKYPPADGEQELGTPMDTHRVDVSI